CAALRVSRHRLGGALALRPGIGHALSQADAAPAERVGRAASGHRSVLTPAARQDVAAFLRHLKSELGLSPHTVVAYRRDLAQLAGFADGIGVDDWSGIDHRIARM